MDEHTIWTEKYRPQTFSEVRGQEHVVVRVQQFVEKRNMPHLLFAGPAGVGKTTLALVIARELFGDSWKGNVLELNASDERGIDVIRNTVKDFARTKGLSDVPFKIIYLDECLGYDTNVIVRKPGSSPQELTIGEFVESAEDESWDVLSVNDDGKQIFVPIVAGLKIPHKKAEGFYSIQAHGRKISATGNHLFLTRSGWKEARQLKRGDMILCPLAQQAVKRRPPQEALVYEVVGLPREIKKKERYITGSPERAVLDALAAVPPLTRKELQGATGISSSQLSSILSERNAGPYLSLPSLGIVQRTGELYDLASTHGEALQQLYAVQRTRNSSNTAYVTRELGNLGLWPLSDEKQRILARLLGHLFGDGTLSLKAKQVSFSGKEEDMERIRQDLNKLGFHALGNVKRKTWKNGECWSFGAYRIALLSLFYSLGTPVGRKTDTHYTIPRWIMEGGRTVQREFLRAFFGSEGSMPSFQGRTVKPIVIGQAKREDLRDNLETFLKQVQALLGSFGVSSRVKISQRIKNIRKDGTRTIEGKVWVTNGRKNIVRFLEFIGYAYARSREKKAKRVSQYLRWKETLGRSVHTFRPVPHFDEWSETLLLGESAFFYVTDIQRQDDPEFVYCLQTENEKFVANGMVVHNCDALTREAQQALRRTMENYTHTTRFILSCNYSSKIIDPIQSRCAVFRFKPLPSEALKGIVEGIAKKEGFTIDERGVSAAIEVAQGDVRRLENVLQAAASNASAVTEDLIYDIASFAKPDEVGGMLAAAVAGKFLDARKLLLKIMLDYGLSGLDVVKQAQQAVWKLDMDDRQKLELVKLCGEAEFRMVEGADETVQLEALLAGAAMLPLKSKI